MHHRQIVMLLYPRYLTHCDHAKLLARRDAALNIADMPQRDIVSGALLIDVTITRRKEAMKSEKSR